MTSIRDQIERQITEGLAGPRQVRAWPSERFNCFARWEYRSDRFVLDRWRKSLKPRGFSSDLIHDTPEGPAIVLHMWTDASNRVRCDLTFRELNHARDGWRRLVADRMREMRHFLRNKRK